MRKYRVLFHCMLFPIWPVIDAISLLTIGSQIFIAFLLIILAYELLGKTGCTIMHRWIARHGLLLMFIVATTAMLGSLFFSEIAEFIPCLLCWYQRIFMYPQVFLLGLALYKRDTGIAPYILTLSIIGFAIAVFHYTEQVQSLLNPEVFDPKKPCDLTGISCRATEILEYGYITIPMMALTAFALNILGSIAMMRCEKWHPRQDLNLRPTA